MYVFSLWWYCLKIVYENKFAWEKWLIYSTSATIYFSFFSEFLSLTLASPWTTYLLVRLIYLPFFFILDKQLLTIWHLAHSESYKPKSFITLAFFIKPFWAKKSVTEVFIFYNGIISKVNFVLLCSVFI